MFGRIKRMWPLRRVNQAGPQSGKGQSLVEMAIIAPLLLLLFIGVLEVGYAIRSYVVLVNADREATRFGARGLYLDFNQTNPNAVGYSSVLSHTLDSIAQQLPFDVTSPNPNGTLIVSHYVVDTGKPCANPPCCRNNSSDCDCSLPSQRKEDYPDDDLILYPGKEGYDYFTAFYGIPRESRINFEELVAQLKQENDAFNCALNLRDPTAPWSVNSGIVVETFYTQHQLLGVPIISNYFTDPYELYAHTVMRLPEGGIEGCEVFPIALRLDKANATQVGERLTDGWDGSSGGGFGWLSWNPAKKSAVYLREELENPRLAANDFTDAKQPTDDALNVGDDVAPVPGVNFTTDAQIRDLLLQKRIVVIPVWDPGESDGSGSNAWYRIVRFVRVQVETGIDPSGNPDDKSIALRMMEDPADVCPGNGW
jgi:hypothetical protein